MLVRNQIKMANNERNNVIYSVCRIFIDIFSYVYVKILHLQIITLVNLTSMQFCLLYHFSILYYHLQFKYIYFGWQTRTFSRRISQKWYFFEIVYFIDLFDLGKA